MSGGCYDQILQYFNAFIPGDSGSQIQCYFSALLLNMDMLCSGNRGRCIYSWNQSTHGGSPCPLTLQTSLRRRLDSSACHRARIPLHLDGSAPTHVSLLTTVLCPRGIRRRMFAECALEILTAQTCCIGTLSQLDVNAFQNLDASIPSSFPSACIPIAKQYLMVASVLGRGVDDGRLSSSPLAPALVQWQQASTSVLARRVRPCLLRA